MVIGVNNVITGCIDKAVKICSTSKSTIQQLDEFRSYWRSKTSLYTSRRDKTYRYIVELDKQGKFSAENLVDLTASGASAAHGNGQYAYPVAGGATITATYGSGYGSYYKRKHHTGIDIAAAKGTPIYSVTSGTVLESNCGSAYGIHVFMKADDGMYILYAHLLSKSVNPGTKISKGYQIGRMDSTGNSTGNHLHFEIRKAVGYGSDVNPLPYIGLSGDRGSYYGKYINFK